MSVNASAGVATPANTSENLMSLGIVLGLFEQGLSFRTHFFVMASNGLLEFVSRVSI